MRQCKKCGKKGLFLKIMKAKNEANTAKASEKIASLCKSIEHYGNELIALHQAYNLKPSQELLSLIETYKKKRELAEK